VCVADALPLLPPPSGLNNQIHESASSLDQALAHSRPHTASSEPRRYRVPISPISRSLRRALRAPIYCSTLHTPLIPDSVTCCPHPRSVPPSIALEQRGSVWLPHRAACLGHSLGCCLCYRIVARKQPLDAMGMVHRLWRTASYFASRLSLAWMNDSYITRHIGKAGVFFGRLESVHR